MTSHRARIYSGEMAYLTKGGNTVKVVGYFQGFSGTISAEAGDAVKRRIGKAGSVAFQVEELFSAGYVARHAYGVKGCGVS